MHKLGVFIGRFQPMHEGHIHALKEAAKQVDHLLILLGSANQCVSIKNPWTAQERFDNMVKKLDPVIRNYTILPLNDYRYNNSQWMSDVRSTVEYFCAPMQPKITLFGHYKEGNDYLRWFPDWNFKHIESEYKVNATQIREQMFHIKSALLPSYVHADFEYYENEKKLFSSYPFPETLSFNCADAVVECQGHVLLIQRARAPGQGCFALPGGFKNRNETFLDCAIRELFEETNLRVPEKVVRGSVKAELLFDSPTRSFGIARNTLAVYIRLSPDPTGKLPRASGGDDASNTKWVTLDEALNDYSLYDDHLDIISKMTGVVARPAYFIKKLVRS